jgi:methylenetetrahydrofolate dehydrogenase (NADP+)/methenyltetrahydrofolate cyclohydrolase
MAKILSGKEVVAALNEQLSKRAQVLVEKGVEPCLAMVRVGERQDDIAYERGATNRCKRIGISTKNFILPESATQEELIKVIEEVNNDPSIHGCLLFRPLPEHFDDEVVRNALLPAKDVDGITNGSLAGVFAGTDQGYPPCTPAACMEILEHFGIDLNGKKATVIGRSLVVGRPAALMLTSRNATATVCHTRTIDMPSVTREAEVVIVAAGRANLIGKEYFSPGQVVIDVGINFTEEGTLCGDVNFAEAEPIVAAISPVPGGVGTVTTSVLAKHVIEAAEKTLAK